MIKVFHLFAVLTLLAPAFTFAQIPPPISTTSGSESASDEVIPGIPIGFRFQIDLKKFSTRSPDVKYLQLFLKDQGLYNGPITGGFYDLTEAAVLAFQEREGIQPAIGVFGSPPQEKPIGVWGPKSRARANEIIEALESGVTLLQPTTTQTTQTTQTTPTDDAGSLADCGEVLGTRVQPIQGATTSKNQGIAGIPFGFRFNYDLQKDTTRYADVRYLQIFLKDYGVYPKLGPITGFFLDLTSQAVLAFQKREGIPPAKILVGNEPYLTEVTVAIFGPKSREKANLILARKEEEANPPPPPVVVEPPGATTTDRAALIQICKDAQIAIPQIKAQEDVLRGLKVKGFDSPEIDRLLYELSKIRNTYIDAIREAAKQPSQTAQ